MMHKIDLLKGQGIPAKTTTGGVFILIATVVVPFLAAAGVVDWYMRTKTEMGVKQQAINSDKKMISEYAPDVKLQNSRKRDIVLLNSKLTEISRCLTTFLQWTPILETLAREMPDRMIMSDLTAQSSSGGARRTTRRDNDPNKPLTIPVPERTLVMNIHGVRPGNYDPIVQQFQERLDSSAALKPKLTKIVHSRQAGTPGSDQMESHEMKIIFEPKSQ
jgi:hypothetical protein